MRIVPVIDLQGGCVVRGVAGNRDQYRPLQSALTDDVSPGGIAAAFASLPGMEEIYVADLDAIAGGSPDWSSLERIAACGLKLWVDGGLRSADDARRLASFAPGDSGIKGVVVALETAAGPDFLKEVIDVAGAERCILSIDLRSGRPLTSAPCWTNCSPPEIAAQAAAIGVRRMIVLDLASVGVYDGGSQLDLCAKLRAAHGDIELISGGGVRDASDLKRFAAAGCDAVLVASALHDLRLTSGDLAAVRSLQSG